MSVRLIIFAFFCLLPLELAANDSSARLEAGGLRLIEEKDIVMEAEDLFISRAKVHIEYTFRNTSAADKNIIVAFPLPTIKTASHSDSDIGVQSEKPLNFVDFKIWADGKAVTPTQDVRAWLNGKDISRLLRQYNIPFSVFDPKFYDALSKMPPAAFQALKAAGAIAPDSTAEQAFPRWTFQVGYFWSQIFPAGRAVKFIQTYKPVVGASLGQVEFMLSDAKEMSRMSQVYCMDLEFQKALKAIQAAKPKDSVVMSHELGYILTTANNWQGPIGKFRLTIDTAAPGKLMSTCVPGLKKLSPTRWSVERLNYRPDRDLSLFFADYPQ